MEYKNFPLGYGNLDDNFKYIYIILNIFLDNDLLDKNYLLIDKKDHGKRLMNFDSENGLITFTKGKDGDKYFLDLEQKKILKDGTNTEFNGSLFDEFPTYLLGSIGFFNISDDYKKIELGENIKRFKSLLEKLNLNNFESFNKETFERTEIKGFLKEIFYTSSIYNRVNEYLKLGRITDFILKDIISFSHESDPRKEKLNSFIDEKIKSDINLKAGISKADFENSFAVINGQTGRNANNRTAWIYEYLSFLGFITFDYKGNIVFYNDGFSELLEKTDQNIKNKSNDLIKNNIMNNKLTSQEALLLLSLLTKPFSILYGVSGTGKSRVVRELWKKFYGEENFKDYFYKESVPPNWFDETEVLGRYNEIEKYKEGSFITVLEKSIKDKDNKYVYLLDEMNLSHIEQYFAQYLSAVEDLSSDNAWIHVGDTKNYSIKKYLESKVQDEIVFDFNTPVSLVKEYSFEKGKIDIDGTEIVSDRDFADFHKKIFKYIVDNFSDSENENIFDGTEIKTLTQKEDEGLIILNKDTLDINNENGVNFYVTKDTWKKGNTGNEFFYKGYAISTGYNLDNRIREVKKLVEFIGKEYLNQVELIFKSKDSEKNTSESKNVIYYYKDSELIGKSLKTPTNLFVVGTINLDETTKSISPKVVDRANLIEFNDIDNYTFLKDNGSYDLAFLEGINSNIDFNKSLELRLTYDKWNSSSLVWELKKENQTLMQRLYDYLKVFKLHFSYRTINEILTFVAIGKEVLGNEYEDKLLDLAFMQKVLPKLNGVIDPSFRLSDDKGEKYLYYISDDIEDSIMNTYPSEIKEILKSGVLSVDNEKLDNTFIKLKRMQQFFNTYQNVNYFLS